MIYGMSSDIIHMAIDAALGGATAFFALTVMRLKIKLTMIQWTADFARENNYCFVPLQTIEDALSGALIGRLKKFASTHPRPKKDTKV